MRNFAILLVLAAGISGSACSNLEASVLTGTYTLGGATTGTGPYQLTSTNSTFSVLRFVPDVAPLFSSLTDFHAIFSSPTANALPSQTPLNAGGGGGAPRIVLVLDSNGNSVFDTGIDGTVDVHLGTSPGFVDTPAGLSALSGMNLINNDAGRYDLSFFTPNPGSPFTDYATTLAAVGSATVLRFSLILDSFGGADKTLNVESIGAAAVDGAVPEPGTIIVWGLLAFTAVGGSFCRTRDVLEA